MDKLGIYLTLALDAQNGCVQSQTHSGGGRQEFNFFLSFLFFILIFKVSLLMGFHDILFNHSHIFCTSFHSQLFIPN